MQFYTKQHKSYCGIALHARSMYVCVLNQDGDIVLHRPMQASPDTFLRTVAPSRDALVVAVACVLPWSWLADLWAQEGMPLVLGQALSRKAIHGGKAKNAKSAAHQIAVLLRGGMLPQADVDPAEMRATRDLLRRRLYLSRKRAELLAHIQNTQSQYTLPEIGKKLADKAKRAGVAERFPDPAVQKSMAVALALRGDYDHLRSDGERPIVKAAKQHDAQTLYWLQTVPGIGKILRLVLRYEIHDIQRFPRGQDFVASCRRVKWAKASAGKRSGTSGSKIGNAYLNWAFSEAAGLFLRDPPAGQQYLARLEKKHGTGKALTVLAQKLGRAVYAMLRRNTGCDMDNLLHR
jgi:transposase